MKSLAATGVIFPTHANAVIKSDIESDTEEKRVSDFRRAPLKSLAATGVIFPTPASAVIKSGVGRAPLKSLAAAQRPTAKKGGAAAGAHTSDAVEIVSCSPAANKNRSRAGIRQPGGQKMDRAGENLAHVSSTDLHRRAALAVERTGRMKAQV